MPALQPMESDRDHYPRHRSANGVNMEAEVTGTEIGSAPGMNAVVTGTRAIKGAAAYTITIARNWTAVESAAESKAAILIATAGRTGTRSVADDAAADRRRE